jgi:hypothetical protein
MINVMLMTVHALKKFFKMSCAALPQLYVALPHKWQLEKNNPTMKA